MNNKLKAALGLLLILAITAGFCFLGVNGARDIKLGLDLNGGVSITYQTVEPNPTAEQMSDTIYKLQLKAQGYSTEAQVYQEGSNRINIDIPGATDANEILAELGEPGTLQFADVQGNVLLTGDDVKNASAGMTNNNGTNEYIIQLTFTDEGAKKFADATANNVGNPLFIIYNDNVISAPTVQEAISGGQASITGISDYDEATRIASTIRIGALPLQLTELRSNVIGATLGQEAISTSIKAGIIGLGLVMLFMIVFYLLPGFTSSLALIMYTGLELVILQAFEVTLTLPGIAGIILSIGMAVDANVIIFTRIKEELGLGNSVENSIKAGYSKALSAILDGNITTLIAAAVLYLRGSGTVKGFASTLAIGIVISLITALFVTRSLLWTFVQFGATDPKLYGVRKDIKIFDFIKFRKKAYTASAVVILAGFIFLGMNKASIGNLFNYDLDFQGGSSTNVTFNEDLSLEDVDAKVSPIFKEVTGGDASVQASKVAGTNEVIIKTRTLTTEERKDLYQKLVDEFSVDESKITTENISGAVSNEMKADAVWAFIIAIICMLIYIWIRFKDIRFASASVLALTHDVLVTVAFYAGLKWAVGSTFIACILTIVGYSINATIVVFDRIRENLADPEKRKDKADCVNTAISQTLTRSINTSLTTFIMVIVLYIFGVSSIRDFTMPLMVGIVAGAWSSITIAGPLWFDLTNRAMKKQAEKAAAEKAAKLEAKAAKKTAKK
ncbi:MAG: protein translocase subunit SecD [Oribacterium sp.]|nr:protein translocase subunit SecD [Oribacterium sp.]MBO6309751.1 protein translocase subunit SecD [Oribacterium sp.]